MKNQLRKATLRAAALTMSATIAATSVPMTAFANEGTAGQDGGDDKDNVKQEQQQDSASNEKEIIKQEKEKTNPAVEAAYNASNDIAPAENIKTDTLSEAVSNVQTATSNAYSVETSGIAEKTKGVAEDINELDKEKVAVVESQATLTTKEEAATSQFNTTTQLKEDTDTAIIAAQTSIDNAKYKEDAQVAYNDVIQKVAALEAAVTDLNTKKKEYNDAIDDLEKKLSAYDTSIEAGITDLAEVEKQIKTAQENIIKLGNEVSNISTEVKKTAAEVLLETYNNPDTDKKVEVFKEILKGY